MPQMPRITEREQVPEGQRHHYDSIITTRKEIGAPYYFLLHCPDLAARTAHLLAYCRFESSLPEDLKELAVCTAAREMDCSYEWAAHEGDAQKAGVREEAISIIRDRKDQSGLTTEEARVVSFVQEMLRPPHRVSRTTFQGLLDAIGETQMAELTGTVGAYVGLACSLNAFDVHTPEGRPVLPT